MSPENTSATKICPTCGTRLTENATRCLVCGRNFVPAPTAKSPAKAIKGPKMPEVTISLPVALGLLLLVLAIGAAVVYFVLQGTGRVVEPTVTPTVTVTATATPTPTTSPTGTPIPTFTPLPTLEYIVKSGDYCSTIAGFFNVSVNSIILMNNLPTDCSSLVIGQKLFIPQPTPTASPQPSSTLSGVQATDAACEKIEYTVAENDTLGGIARNYNVSMDAIKEYNGMTSDVVYQGQPLTIPLCERLPTPGPTSTPTPPPPYSAPNLLLPADGTAFANAADSITLQWASVGTLRDNESYMVTVEDITEGTGRRLTQYVTDTKLIIPATFRPNDTVPHVIRWTVTTVRQTSTDKEGQPVWVSAGAVSTPRVFTWWGTGSAPVNTPAP